MKIRTNKKGVIEQLTGLIVPLVAIGIILAVGFLIMAEAQSQAAEVEGITCDGTTGGYACNGTRATINAIADIPGWLPIIVITVIGALLIGLVAHFRGK